MADMEQLLEWLNAERGRRVFLARELGINSSAISQWDRVPIDRALDIERITGISRHYLCPRIFGEAPEVAAE